MWNILYIVVLSVLVGYGFYSRNRTRAMWHAASKTRHSEEIYWTPSQRRKLAQASKEEIEYRNSQVGRIKPPFGGG